MKAKTRRRIRTAGGVLFAVYLAAVVYLLFFAESYRRGDGQAYRLNLIPFNEIRRFLENRDTLGDRAVFLNVYGNVLLFVPFGAIFPVLGRCARGALSTISAGMAFSVCVEVLQLISRRGSCDIDDVMLNTFGAAAGYALFFICRAVYRRLTYGRTGKKIRV